MEPSVFQKIMQETDRELWVVTGAAGPRRGGLIATYVSPASIVPTFPRVMLSLARHHLTFQLVENSLAFALHLLSEDQVPWVWHFGLQSGWDMDKLAGIPFHKGKTGSPLLEEAPAWLDCRVLSRLNTGDRTIFLAEVVDAGQVRPGPVLTLKKLWSLAPPDKKQRMEELKNRDMAVDRVSISDFQKIFGH